MKRTLVYKRPIVLFLLLYATTSYAQQENWETYMGMYDKKPGSVLVDLGQITNAPDKRLPYLLITGPTVKKCNPDGLPDIGEIPQLEQVLDATDEFITGVTAKALVGTFMYNCQRVNYYYVHDTIGLRNALGRMYARNFKDYTYAVTIKYDPEWKDYRTFLYPTEETFNWIENNKIIVKLLQQGEDLSKVKHIRFTIYFKTTDDRKAFLDYAHKTGFNVDEMDNVKGGDMPYAIVISKNDFVKNITIDDMTAGIKSEAKARKALYDGWDITPLK